MAKDYNPPKYKIEKTTYTYKKNEDGSRSQIGDPKKSVVKGVNNFQELRSSLHNNKKDSQFINYEDPTYSVHKNKFGKIDRVVRDTPRLHSVTETKANGTIEVSYFNAVKGK